MKIILAAALLATIATGVIVPSERASHKVAETDGIKTLAATSEGLRLTAREDIRYAEVDGIRAFG